MIIFLPFIFIAIFILITLLGFSTSYHNNSLLSIVVSIFFIFLINNLTRGKLEIQKIDKLSYQKLFRSLLDMKFKTLFISIVVFNVLVNLCGFYILQNKIDYTSFVTTSLPFSVKNYITLSTTLTIIMAQVGGLFLQAVLIYCLIILLDININFNETLKITTISYLGFLITSICLFFINLYTFKSEIILPNDIEMNIKSSFIIPVIGKFGEYLTLSLVTFYLLNKNISFKKSLFVSVFPSFLILAIVQLFKYAF